MLICLIGGFGDLEDSGIRRIWGFSRFGGFGDLDNSVIPNFREVNRMIKLFGKFVNPIFRELIY